MSELAVSAELIAEGSISLTKSDFVSDFVFYASTLEGHEPLLTLHSEGHVTYHGTPDEATQLFMESLAKSFPEFSKNIQRKALEAGAAEIDKEATVHSSLAYADCSRILHRLKDSL